MSKKLKMSIGRKIALMTVTLAVIVTLVGIGLIYFIGSNLLMNMLGKQYSQVAMTLAALTAKTLTDEIDDVKSYATRRLWIDAVAEVNLKYSKMNEADIENYMIDMDKKWAAAENGSLFLIEYLRNRISLGMQDAAHVRSFISEILMTDKYGGLVAASGKTTDFYQADEAWWKGAYDGGKGNVFVGNVEFDDSSKSWVTPIAVPMFDHDKKVIGVVKYSISIERLFGGLADFSIGDTGHAIFIGEDGKIIFHHSIGTMKEYISINVGLDALSRLPRPYRIVTDKFLHNKKMLVAPVKISSPYLDKAGISWSVLVIQEWAEASKPLDNFVMGSLIVLLFALIIVVSAGYILGNLIAKPINALHVATEHVMAGDLDYIAEINTGDEIEDLANAFNLMIADIKYKEKEIKDFSKGLEAKVEERTKELSVAQEATLNVLEDLQTSKEEVERTNKDLLQLDQLKSDFISTVSHELRTPLSIIKEGISLVLDKIPGQVNEKQAKILDISKYNIDRLARIIDGLLDISKIEAGKVEFKMGLVNISDVVKEAAVSFEIAAKDKGLELRLDLDKMTGNVYADPDKIMQVLINLINNAIKFTSSGSITISCKDKGDAVTCSVADTGLGISKEDMPKVFSKFQQFNRQAGAGDKGTGLGLYIAKNLIDRHNGSIWVESEPGKGTKFTFKLRKYTSQSLLNEHVAKALNNAAQEDVGLAVIAIKASIPGPDEDGAIKKKFNGIMQASTRLIKNSLRRQSDDVVNNNEEIIVILTNCDKEGSARVQHRIEEVINKYLTEQKMDGSIKIDYGYATYPGDGKSEIELLAKAKIGGKDG